MNAPVYRSRLIEINLPTGIGPGSEIAFPDQPDLREAVVTGFETFTENNIQAGPSGVLAVTTSDALALVLVMTEASDEKVKFVPYSSCVRANNAGLFREYRALRPTWEQCKVRTVANLTASTPTVALVLVHYFYPKDVR